MVIRIMVVMMMVVVVVVVWLMNMVFVRTCAITTATSMPTPVHYPGAPILHCRSRIIMVTTLTGGTAI